MLTETGIFSAVVYLSKNILIKKLINLSLLLRVEG